MRPVHYDIAYGCFLVSSLAALAIACVTGLGVGHGVGIEPVFQVVILTSVVALPVGCAFSLFLWRDPALVILGLLSIAFAIVMVANRPFPNSVYAAITSAYGLVTFVLVARWFMVARWQLREGENVDRAN